MATNTSIVPFQNTSDIKTRTETVAYIGIKKAVQAYVDTTQNKCWDLVEAAYIARKEGLTEEATRALFNKAFAEVYGDVKDPDYITNRNLGAKAVKIASNVTHEKLTKLRKKLGFMAIYTSLKKPTEGRPPTGVSKEKEELEEIVKEGGPMADTAKEQLRSMFKGKKTSTNSDGEEPEEPERKYWSATEGKSIGDPWYKETKAILSDTPNKFMAAITKLAKNDILTTSLMSDLIEAYIGDDLEEIEPRWDELINQLANSTDEAKAAILKRAKVLRAKQEDDEEADKRAAKVLGDSPEDEENYQQKRITQTRQKRLVGKKR